jgi:hypothetical protein
LISFERAIISIDGNEAIDYIFDHKLFDKLWLVNRFKVVVNSSTTKVELESIANKEKREYLMKGYEHIPIEAVLRVGSGSDGVLDPYKAPWRPKPIEKVAFLNSLIRQKKMAISDASKLLWLMHSNFVISENKLITRMIRLCEIEFGYAHTEILTSSQFESLLNELLANDEFCRFHSQDTLRPFSSLG